MNKEGEHRMGARKSDREREISTCHGKHGLVRERTGRQRPAGKGKYE